MDLPDALEFAGRHHQSVLATVRSDGRPQLSNVLHAISDDGSLTVSVTADRAKYRNLVRDPWAALHVTQPDFWGWAVIEADVTLEAVDGPDDPVIAELVEHYRTVVGEHADWDAFRRSQVTERRVLVRLAPRRAYGMVDLTR
jgi:PPOX class probable F420-dependent enzyme